MDVISLISFGIQYRVKITYNQIPNVITYTIIEIEDAEDDIPSIISTHRLQSIISDRHSATASTEIVESIFNLSIGWGSEGGCHEA